MERLLLVAAVLVVPRLSVGFESLDAVAAPCLVEPAELEEIPCSLDLVGLGKLGRYGKVNTVGGCNLFPGLARTQFPDLDIVGGEMVGMKTVGAVIVIFVPEHLCVVGKALAVVLVIVYDPPLVAVTLGEPDGGGVVHAQIPGRVDRQALLVGNDGDPVLPVDALELVGEVGTFQACLEGLVEG